MSLTEQHFRPLGQLTEAQLRERIAFHEEEARQEWCGTLILEELRRLRRELDRRALREGIEGPDPLMGDKG